MHISFDPVVSGVIAGACHHFVLQYPGQAKILPTICALFFENVIFGIIAILLKRDLRPFEVGRLVFVFATVQVSQLLIVLTRLFVQALTLKIIYNVYLRHRGIPTRFWWAATDLKYWRVYAGGQSHTVIENLHKELGIYLRFANDRRCRANTTKPHQLQFAGGSRSNSWCQDKGEKRRGL
jgi:hypothetical protein